VLNADKYLFVVTLTTMSVHVLRETGWSLVHSATVKQSRGASVTKSIGVVSFCADGNTGRFIWGDRTFWTLEPTSKKATPLLDQVTFPDYYSGTAVGFAMAIFPLEQELLVCFNTCGFFATFDGNRSRECKFNWANQPKAFALLGNCLYVFSWGTLELYDTRPGNTASRTIILEGIEYLGMSKETVFASINTTSTKGSSPTPQIIAMHYTHVDELDVPAYAAARSVTDENESKALQDTGQYIGVDGYGEALDTDYCVTVPHVSLALGSPFQKLHADSCC